MLPLRDDVYNRFMRKNDEEKKLLYDEAIREVKEGQFYAHYKHPGEKKYKVVAVGLMEDTWVPMVTYEHLSNGVRVVRTLENFTEEVGANGIKVRRFEEIK
jgi:hypothetical protein